MIGRIADALMLTLIILYGALPNKARRFCGRTIGRLWVGSGWYAYPTASGWHAVNYKNFNGWFSL